MSYLNNKDNTPEQQAACLAQAEVIKASDARITAANKVAQDKIDAALAELKAVCDTEGRGTYINPTSEYGGGMYYQPPLTKKYYSFDADGNALREEGEPDTWENSDAGWQSSSTNC